MSSNPQSWSPDNPDAKPSFRKRSNYAASRKYRRHSPLNGSSSSDGSPKHGRSPSIELSREDSEKAPDNRWKRKNSGRELDRESGRSRSDKSGGDLYRYSEKQSVGSSHHHRKHDDYSRHHRHDNDGERKYGRSSRSGREPGSDNRRRESDHARSRDYRTDKNIQDKPHKKDFRSKDKDRDGVFLEHQKHNDASDQAISGRGRSNSVVEEVRIGERNSHRRSSGDYRDSDTFSNDESRGRGRDFRIGSQLKETSKGNTKELARRGHTVEKTHEDEESDRHMDRYQRESDENNYRSSSNFRKRDWRNEQKEDETSRVSEDHDASAKKYKMVESHNQTGYVKDGSSSLKSTSRADEKPLLSSKQIPVTVSRMTSEQAQSSSKEAEGSQDINAAKNAAMKAAELVNLNLTSSGFMSTDQKKKLLWGNKKSVVASEETGNRWDTSLFPDKERQEKFYKLMSLRLRWYLLPIVGCEGRREDREQAQRQRWKWWCPPSREAAGAPVGFREAVHSRTPPERWTHRWPWFVIVIFVFCTLLMPSNIYFCARYAHGSCALSDIMFLLPRLKFLQKIC